MKEYENEREREREREREIQKGLLLWYIQSGSTVLWRILFVNDTIAAFGVHVINWIKVIVITWIVSEERERERKRERERDNTSAFSIIINVITTWLYSPAILLDVVFRSGSRRID